jgi:hypothetical protein
MFNTLHNVRWAAYSEGASVEDMGVNHCGAHVPMAQQPLDSPDVLSPFQQVCCLTWPKASVAEPLGMTKGMAADSNTCEPVRTASVPGSSQPRGYHLMVRVLLELLQQEARLVGLGVARPVAHQAAQDFAAAHPHCAAGIFDCLLQRLLQGLPARLALLHPQAGAT